MTCFFQIDVLVQNCLEQDFEAKSLIMDSKAATDVLSAKDDDSIKLSKGKNSIVFNQQGGASSIEIELLILTTRGHPKWTSISSKRRDIEDGLIEDLRVEVFGNSSSFLRGQPRNLSGIFQFRVSCQQNGSKVDQNGVIHLHFSSKDFIKKIKTRWVNVSFVILHLWWRVDFSCLGDNVTTVCLVPISWSLSVPRETCYQVPVVHRHREHSRILRFLRLPLWQVLRAVYPSHYQDKTSALDSIIR